MQNSMREKMLEKLLEFFQEMPDQEESEMPMDDKDPKGVKVEMLSVGKADPKEDMLKKMKGC